MMSTHRAIQINVLLDTIESKVRGFRKASSNLHRIGNHLGSDFYQQKAARFEKLADICRGRLNAA